MQLVGRSYMSTWPSFFWNLCGPEPRSTQSLSWQKQCPRHGAHRCSARVATCRLQTSDDPVTCWKWVDYSAFDAKATWDLFHSLRERLEANECHLDGELRAGLQGGLREYSQWDLYQDVVRPFGGLLTEMEDVRAHFLGGFVLFLL
jgi:hypothetical protein